MDTIIPTSDMPIVLWSLCTATIGTAILVPQLFRAAKQAKNALDGTLERMTVVELFQTFFIKLVLEVFGGVGAIWGFSEVLTLRHPGNENLWRIIALPFGVVFFIRLVRGLVIEPSGIEDKSFFALLKTFGARLILEVFGGGGAIWGYSEICKFRNPETVFYWRPCAAVFGLVFFVRFCVQIADFLRTAKVLETAPSALDHIERFSAMIVLEVFGAGGAIWGFSEACTLRNPENATFWRIQAQIIAVIFCVRFFIHIVKAMSSSSSTVEKSQVQITEASPLIV